MTGIAEMIKLVREAIDASGRRVGRDPKSIRVIAISKGVPVERLKEALDAGITDLGENYLQEALPKQEALKDRRVTWHFTGHLQRNKAQAVVEHFQFIHSVDSIRLLEALNRVPSKKIPVLLQLKCHPDSANGFIPENLLNEIEKLAAFNNIVYRGVMAMVPILENAEAARPYFRKARETFDALKPFFPENFSELSMGMSGDFPIAVEEGSTMVRIGTAIFGPRRR